MVIRPKQVPAFKKLKSGVNKTLLASISALVISQPVMASCEYVVEAEWPSGFVASILLTNDTDTAIDGWSVEWQYAGLNSVEHAWQAEVIPSSINIALDLGWNSVIEPGETAKFGIKGFTNGDVVEIPALIGEVCEQNLPQPEPTLETDPLPTISPTPTPTPTPRYT